MLQNIQHVPQSRREQVCKGTFHYMIKRSGRRISEMPLLKHYVIDIRQLERMIWRYSFDGQALMSS